MINGVYIVLLYKEYICMAIYGMPCYVIYGITITIVMVFM